MSHHASQQYWHHLLRKRQDKYRTRFYTSLGKSIDKRFNTKKEAEAWLPRRHFHALRHTHATELLAKGIPIIEVSKRLGHSKVSHTLDLYGHAIPGYGSKIADIVAEMLKATAN